MNTLRRYITASTGKRPDIALQIRVEPSEHGLLLTDENGCIRSANPTFCRWIGYACDELLGMRFQQLLSQEARAFQQMYWQPLMEVQGAVANVKFDFVHRAGFMLPMISSAITCQYSNAIVHELTLYDPQGQRYEYELLVARLLAERCLAKNLKVQHELLSSRRSSAVQVQVDPQAAFSRHMLGMVSHDLRTPLLTIRMATELLERRSQTDKTRELLRHISQSVARAQRLVADLLDYTLIQGGQDLSIHPGVADLSKVVGACVEELRLTYPSHSLLYEHFGERRAMFDKDRLYQLIGNQVATAVAYGDTGLPGRVTSRTEGSITTLSVLNQGAAIPAELLDRLFEPLIRGRHKSVKASNIGLGLFIVKQIAKAHAGDVSVVSSEEEGTCFSVRLCLPCITSVLNGQPLNASYHEVSLKEWNHGR